MAAGDRAMFRLSRGFHTRQAARQFARRQAMIAPLLSDQIHSGESVWRGRTETRQRPARKDILPEP